MSSLLKLRGLNLSPILKFPHIESLLSSRQANSRVLCSLANCSSLIHARKSSIGISFVQCRGLKAATRYPRKKQAALVSEPFLDGTSATYVDEMYEAYQKDPSSVHVVRSQLLV